MGLHDELLFALTECAASAKRIGEKAEAADAQDVAKDSDALVALLDQVVMALKEARGVPVRSFVDPKTGATCSLEESSNAEEPSIWIGIAGPPRLHVTQSQLERLLPALMLFAEIGKLPPPEVPA